MVQNNTLEGGGGAKYYLQRGEVVQNNTFEGGGEGKEPTDNWSKERPVCAKMKIRFVKDL